MADRMAPSHFRGSLHEERRMSLDGKVAVVTGGSSGIGHAISLQLADDGAAIAIWDNDIAAAEQTAAVIAHNGGRAIVCETDVASSASVMSALAHTHAELGPIAILVNNAAMTGGVRFEDLSEELWDRMIAVDLKGPFLCIKAVLTDMLSAGWGRIINITSSSVHTGNPGMAHYVAAKGGLTALTRALAMEYAATGITVNNVPPGYVETPTMRRLQASHPGQQRSFEEMTALAPMKRAGKPEDVAAAVAYLASEAAAYVTGQTIHVNGGRFLG
jgi:2-hydroxycyclohexanecarboxyl-CoA dehydrogenase